MEPRGDRSHVLRLELNPTLGVPIYRQVVDGIRRMIGGSVLKPGDRLPSIRDLSAALRINPSSAVRAYQELEHAGMISTEQGRGTFVTEDRTLATRSREDVLDRELDRLIQAARSLGLTGEAVVERLRIRIKKRPKEA